MTPHLHIIYMLIRHIWLLTGFGQKMMLHGVVCALALQHALTAPHFISGLWQADFTLSPFLTSQQCQMNHIHPYLKTEPPSSSTTSFQGSILQKTLVQTLFSWRCEENLRLISKYLELNCFRLSSLLINHLLHLKVF